MTASLSRAGYRERLAAYIVLRDDGTSAVTAAQAIGISHATSPRYERAYQASKGKPPRKDNASARDERVDRYCALRDEGYSPAEAAEAMRLRQVTGERYERWYCSRQGIPPPSRPRGTGGGFSLFGDRRLPGD